jgi:spermidine synthase
MHPVSFSSPAALLAALAALFFLSGASALIYQVLWLRLLGLVFGVTVYAASTVWAAFMGGLAIGSVLGGRLADRVRRPVLWLGAAEALIGATALATPFALDVLEQLYAALPGRVSGSFATLTLVRLALSSAVLLVPAALMGATLPLIVKSSLAGAGGLGHRVGVLYAANTAGAIAGTLMAGLLLIPRVGIWRSFLIAAALNGVVALSAVLLGRRLGAAPVGTGVVEGVVEEQVTADAPDWRQMLVLAVFAISGFVSLAIEVVWFRVLTLFLRPTVYGYAWMLAAVLAGIALGSYAAVPFLRRRPRRDWLLALGCLEGLVAVAAVLSFAPLPAIPAITAAAGPAVSRITGDYLAYQAVTSAVVVLPAMLLFGAAFPIGLHVWAARDRAAGGAVATRVGLFYSLNVGGAILGSLAAGFLLLPRFGSRGTLVLLAGVTLASALALLAAARTAAWKRLTAALAVSAAFAAGVFAIPDPFAAYLAQRYPEQSIVWAREAVQATVSVHVDRRGNYSLNVSGNHQASTGGAMPWIHQRIGAVPMALHPEPRRALVIGLGGGATAGAVSQYPGTQVDVVELSEEVAQAAHRFFRGINNDVLRRPNVRLRVDDGRNYLLTTTRRYDVVTADVILPIHAGAGNLYSEEYFRLVRGALEPGGLVLQWVSGTEAEYKLIMRTFLRVFPNTTLWGDGSLMLGSVEPLRLRRADFERKLQSPAGPSIVATLGVKSFDKLLEQYVAGPDELRRYVGDGPVLTDDRPLVEYFLSLPRDREVDLGELQRGDVARHLDEP